MTDQDAIEFRAYLRNCNRDQLFAVLDKETAAGRDSYTKLVLQEIKARLATAMAMHGLGD